MTAPRIDEFFFGKNCTQRRDLPVRSVGCGGRHEPMGAEDGFDGVKEWVGCVHPPRAPPTSRPVKNEQNDCPFCPFVPLSLYLAGY